jgi:4-diphosphocytidyl-2-C-methyl-D-erythritol kinase
MSRVRVPAYAKVNLALRILGRRADGYHELRTIFQSISLHDTLTLSRAPGTGIELTVNMRETGANRRARRGNSQTSEAGDAGATGVPSGPENLVWRALELLRRELKLRMGLRAVLEKRIPAGGGLGGGSSDAAAAMVALLRLARRTLPAERLAEIATSLGSDVPYFLHGGTALGLGRGNEIFPLPDAPPATLLVVVPRGIRVATREAYAWLGARLTRRKDARKILSFGALFRSRREFGLENDFEAAVFRRHPRLAGIKRELLRQGAAEAALAGSGSAVFGLFQYPAQARRAAQVFVGDRVFLARTFDRKKYLRALGWQGLM